MRIDHGLRRSMCSLAAVAGIAALAAACSGGSSGSSGSRSGSSDGGANRSASTLHEAAPSPVQPAAPVWLCQPGQVSDPCRSDLTADVVTATGARSVEHTSMATDPKFDCFYVYPTVSSEKGPNADLAVQPSEVAAARYQAARFSSVCRVWAPMYRQVTVGALFTGGLAALNTAYASLLADWRYYLQHDNGGRPFILIGHSQGAAMLIRLIAEQIDPDPSLRARLVVAILAGGNLQVPTGRDVGATFKHIPLCTSASAGGCAIAYSTFGSPPPAGALFGRPGMGVSLMSLQFTSTGQQVACVNPAALGGGTGPLSPYFPQGGTVSWVTYPRLYTATCRSEGGATWLQVDHERGPGDTRPVVTANLGAAWGYHVDDVNLALGNLVADVSALEAARGG